MYRTWSLTIACLFLGMTFAGCTGDTTTATIEAATPQATVEAAPRAPRVGEPVSFTATAATVRDTASWSFGDGATASGTTVSHTYATPGQYIALLNLTNAAGRSSTNDASLAYITVTARPQAAANVTELTAPVAVAASDKQVIEPGGTVSFNAAGSGSWTANPEFDPADPVITATHNAPFLITEENTTFAWDFGDGASETSETASETVNHTFASAGLYTVKLTVTDAGGRSSEYAITIRSIPVVPSSVAVRNPTVFTTATISEPESLDPAYDYEVAGGAVIQQVYETLYFYKRDSADQLVPRLAAAMPTMSEGNTVLTIKIRPNVRFHNDDTLDAEDVKFSLDRTILMNDPNGPAWIYAPVKGAEEYQASDGDAAARDAYLDAGGIRTQGKDTVVITLAYPDPAFLYRLAFTAASIVSKQTVCANAEPDFVDCLPPPGESRHPWMDTNAIGTGPFMLDAWVANQEVILVRNDDYWGDKPALEKVVIMKREDINTRILMLRSGQADDIYVSPDEDSQVLGLPNVKVEDKPGWTIAFVGFVQKFCRGPESPTYQSCLDTNHADAPKGADGEVDPYFFADKNMRQAWTLAFDYDEFYTNVMKKHGVVPNGPLPTGIFGYDASLPAPKRDLEEARRYFAMTNHTDGFSITIFYNNGNTLREKAAQLLAKNVRELGPNIQVDVRGLDFSTAYLPRQRAANMPAFILGWAPDYAFPDNYIVTFAHSKLGVYGKRIGYVNEELDAKLDALLRETDEAKLKAGWSDASKTLNEDVAYLWLYQLANFHVQRDWVKGYYFNPMHAGGPDIGDYSTISKS